MKPAVVTRKGKPTSVPDRTPAPPAKPQPLISRTQWLQTEIVKWQARLFRGANDPELQRRVAESQVGIREAEKNATHYEVIAGGHQRLRVTFYVESLWALSRLQSAFALIWPKMRSEVRIEDRRLGRPSERLSKFTKDIGEERHVAADSKSVCQFCGAQVRVPCTPSRSNACPNRSRGSR